MACSCIHVFEVFGLRKRWRNVARFCLPALKSLLSHPAFCRRRGLRQQWARKVCCCEGSRQLAPSKGRIVIREKRWARRRKLAPFQEQSFFVNAVSDDVSWAKLRTCPRKKLHNPRNWRTSCTLEGGGAFLTAFNLSIPGFIPSSVRRKPR